MEQEFEPNPQERPALRSRQAPEKESADLYYWLHTMTVALVCLVLIFTFLGRLTRVDGASMNNTLEDGELLLVWSLGYHPQQGDIIILNKTIAETLGGDAIVKRVIATGGQTVDIDYDTSTVYVDGVLVEEPYIREYMFPIYEETHIQVPEGSIFVMGDNRNESKDSRHSGVGTIDEDYVLGKAMVAIWPLSKIGIL